MNILLINHYAGSVHHGMEFRPYYFAKEWIKQGHKVTIVAADYTHLRQKNPETKSNIEREIIDGIPYVWIKTPKYKGNGIGRVINIFRFLKTLWGMRKELAERIKPDAVIASSTYPLDIFPARSIAKLSEAKLVYEIHDLWPLTLIEMGGFSKVHPFVWLLQRAENYACKHAYKIISILPKTDEHLTRHGMRQEKFAYIPNGIVTEDWEEPEPLPEEHQQCINELRNRNLFLVGYAGYFGNINAMDVLIDAANKCDNERVHFVLIGKGPFKDELERQTKRDGSNVHFLPAIPKRSIPSFLKEMDTLFIAFKNLPIFRFGVGTNKLFDYMMAEKPVIQSQNAGNDIVKDAGCGKSVDAEDSDAVVRAINELFVMSEEERISMGRKGRVYIMKHNRYDYLSNLFIQEIS